MSLTYGPTLLDVQPVTADDVTVTTWNGQPVTLTKPVTVDGAGAVSFEVPSSNRYLISVKTRYGRSVTRADLQADAAAPATDSTVAAASSALVRAARAPLHGAPVSNRAIGRSNSTTSAVATQTTRVRHVITEDCLGIHLVFVGWGNGEANNAIDATIKAAVEIGGVLLAVTFDGARTRTLVNGSVVRSDVVGATLKKGDVVWVRAMRTIVPGTWLANCALLGTTYGEGSADSDVVDSASTAFTVPASDTGTGWSALSVVSASPSVARSVALIGDSLSNGQNETARELGGYMLRSLPDSVGVLRLTGGGGQVSTFVQPSTNASAGRRRLALAGSCKYAWVEYGINDVNAGDSFETIQANLLKLWQGLASAGLSVVQSTITLWAGGSTDGYLTVEGQGVWAKNPVRVALNDWIRTKPAPLTAVFDMADVVESERNSGKWKAAVGGVALCTDGIHPSTVGHVLIADALRSQAASVFK